MFEDDSEYTDYSDEDGRTASIPTSASARRSSCSADAAWADYSEHRTTVMLQRIAYDVDEAAMQRILDRKGLAGTYDMALRVCGGPLGFRLCEPFASGTLLTQNLGTL